MHLVDSLSVKRIEIGRIEIDQVEIGQVMLFLSARGLTTGEIAEHFGGTDGTKVSKDTISQIIEKAPDEPAT